MDNISGINESSGIGTGLAQVFNPYTPQYDMGEVGMLEYKNRLAKEEAAIKKQEKLNKLRADIKTPLMPPKYVALFKQKADEIFKYPNDNEMQLKILGELDTIANLGHGLYNTSSAARNSIMNQPAGTFKGVEVIDELYDDKTPITMADLFDKSTDYANRLNSITKAEAPIDYIAKVNKAQNAVNPIQNGIRTYISEDMATDAAQRFVTQDGEFNKFYKAQFEQLAPDLQKQYGDYVNFGVQDLAPQLVLNKTGTEPKDQNINVNVGGSEGTGVSDVAPQTFDMNLAAGEGTSKTTLSFDADGYSFTPVEASRAVPSKTYKLDGTPYTEQGIKQMSIGAVVDMPIASQDMNVGGRQFKAGQPIPKEYFSTMRKEPSKYKGKISFKKMATALIDETDNVIFDLNEVENLIGTNQKWGIKGYDKYKANQGKMNTKARYQQEYPELFGGAVMQTTPSGNKKEEKIVIQDW